MARPTADVECDSCGKRLRATTPDALRVLMMSHKCGRSVYVMTCEGCRKDVRAPSIEERTKRFERHTRNCQALNFGRGVEPQP